MNAKSLSKIALRVPALFFIIEGIGSLQMRTVIFSYPGSAVKSITLWGVATLLAPIILGVIVWIFAGTIASWIVDRNDNDESTAPLDAPTLQTIAFVTLGIFFLIQCVPIIAGMIYTSLTTPDDWHQPSLWVNRYFLEKILELILALVLVLGARFFTRLIWRLRRIGVE